MDSLYRVGQKSKPDNFCNNVVYCQPIFITFGRYTPEEICNQGLVITRPIGLVSPPNMVCVTCKILITTFAICFYMFITINNVEVFG